MSLKKDKSRSSTSKLSLGSLLKSSNDSCQDLEQKLQEPGDKEFKPKRKQDQKEEDVVHIKKNVDISLLSAFQGQMKEISERIDRSQDDDTAE